MIVWDDVRCKSEVAVPFDVGLDVGLRCGACGSLREPTVKGHRQPIAPSGALTKVIGLAGEYPLSPTMILRHQRILILAKNYCPIRDLLATRSCASF